MERRKPITEAALAAAKASRQTPPVTEGCGCVFCDLNIARHRTTTMSLTDGTKVEWFHETTRGDVPCTKQK